jgi:alpha-tubulin suppressor-like RCC1 family protein
MNQSRIVHFGNFFLLAIFFLVAGRTQAQLSPSELNNMRVYLEFADPGLSDAQKQDLTYTVHIGMNLWATVLPDLHVTYVRDPAQATRIFRWANYQDLNDPTRPSNEFCPGYWAGCAPPGDHIYFNTRYQPQGDQTNITVHGAHEFDFISREAVFGTYEPATDVPFFYHGDRPTNPGYVRGYFRIPERIQDPVLGMAHEFGHWMGYAHTNIDSIAAIAWYGHPYQLASDGVTHLPAADPRVLSGSHSDLKYPYYGVGTCSLMPVSTYFACNEATYTNMPGNSQKWYPDFKWSLYKDFLTIMDYDNANGMKPPPNGIPVPEIDYNARIMHPFDVTHLHSSVNRVYPKIAGVVRLEKPSGTAYLTSDWSKASSKAQLDVDHQSNPYFVTNVFPQAVARPFIVTRYNQSFAIKPDGRLLAWGQNDFGQLGRGSGVQNALPGSVSPTSGWVTVAPGFDHTLAIRSDGTLWTWGNNQYGQLYASGVTSSNLPVQEMSHATNWFAVAAGSGFSLGLKNDGTLWGWGAGYEGQLGLRDGATGDVFVPTQIKTPDEWNAGARGNRWVSISAGAAHTLALRSDGTLWAFGHDFYGQIGQSFAQNNFFTPVQVGSSTDWVAISAGFYHSLGLRSDGTVWAWGYGEDGEIGNGTLQSTNVPTKVVLSNGSDLIATKVSAGSWHNCAITPVNDLYCWGFNNHGQLGGGASSPVPNPIKVGDGTVAFTDVSVGGYHTLALGSDLLVHAFGLSSNGQLGDTLSDGLDHTSWKNPCRVAATPTVTIASPKSNVVVLSNQKTIVTASTVGQVNRVEYWMGSTLQYTSTEAPYPDTLVNLAPGKYTITAKVFDNYGYNSSSPSITLTSAVFTISGASVTSGSTRNLTTEGTADWVHYGYVKNSTITRKKQTTQILSVGSGTTGYTRRTDAPISVSWTNGTPTGSATNQRIGVSMASTTLTFSGSFHPKSTPQTLKIYLFSKNADAKLDMLLDGNEVDNDWVNTSTTTKAKCYTITLQDPTKGYFAFTLSPTRVGTSGYVGIQAITLK